MICQKILGQKWHKFWRNFFSKPYLRKKLLGDEHPSVAASFNNLALLYQSQGRYTEAEPIVIKAYENTKETLGVNLADSAKSKKKFDGES